MQYFFGYKMCGRGGDRVKGVGGGGNGLPELFQKSRTVLEDRSRLLGLFWKRKHIF